MLKEYYRNTIQWESVGNDGYGSTYAAPVDVENVYIEEDIELIRGQNDTSKADAWFSVLEDVTFTQGDRVTLRDRKYIISRITRYNEPRSDAFRHLEVMLKEVNNG